MQIIDDGHVAISVEIHGGTIRLHPRVPEEGDDHPPIVGAGTFQELKSDVVKLSGFTASGMTRRHIRLIGQTLLNMGYRVLYAERMDAHVMPEAEPMPDGDFAGWWRADLVKSRLLNTLKKGAIC